MEPEYMKMGQAAGAAAHLSHSSGITPRGVDIKKLQDVLKKDGAILAGGS